MTVLHSLAEFAAGGLAGIQATQRDWSPFIAHFTSYQAMLRFRRAISQGSHPGNLADSLANADSASWQIVQEIGRSGCLRANKPTAKESIPDCVCFSECTLPGLLSMAERYGRFGFVFEKRALFAINARPCVYVDRDVHRRIRQAASKRNATAEDQLQNKFNETEEFGRLDDIIRLIEGTLDSLYIEEKKLESKLPAA